MASNSSPFPFEDFPPIEGRKFYITVSESSLTVFERNKYDELCGKIDAELQQQLQKVNEAFEHLKKEHELVPPSPTWEHFHTYQTNRNKFLAPVEDFCKNLDKYSKQITKTIASKIKIHVDALNTILLEANRINEEAVDLIKHLRKKMDSSEKRKMTSLADPSEKRRTTSLAVSSKSSKYTTASEKKRRELLLKKQQVQVDEELARSLADAEAKKAQAEAQAEAKRAQASADSRRKQIELDIELNQLDDEDKSSKAVLDDDHEQTSSDKTAEWLHKQRGFFRRKTYNDLSEKGSLFGGPSQATGKGKATDEQGINSKTDEFYPKRENDSVTEESSQSDTVTLARAINALARNQKRDIPIKFNGDIRRFPQFLASHLARVRGAEWTSLDKRDELYNSLSKELKERYEHLYLIPTVEESYKELLSILKKDYGNTCSIAQKLISTVANGKPVPINDHGALLDYAREVDKLHYQLTSLSTQDFKLSQHVNTESNIKALTKRLPNFLGKKYVMDSTKEDPTGNIIYQFSNFREFMKKQVGNVAMNVLDDWYPKKTDSDKKGDSHAKPASPKRQTSKSYGDGHNAFMTGQSPQKDIQNQTPCAACKGPKTHALFKCYVFEKANPDKRIEILRTNRLCFNCGKSHVPIVKCNEPKHCKEAQCTLRIWHDPMLHGAIEGFCKQLQKQNNPQQSRYGRQNNVPPQNNDTTSGHGDTITTVAQVHVVKQKSGHKAPLLGIVPIKVTDIYGKGSQTTFGILDQCASLGFVTESFAKLLSATPFNKITECQTMTGRSCVSNKAVKLKFGHVRKGRRQYCNGIFAIVADWLLNENNIPRGNELPKLPEKEMATDLNVNVPMVSILIPNKPVTLHQKFRSYVLGNGVLVQDTLIGWQFTAEGPNECNGSFQGFTTGIFLTRNIENEIEKNLEHVFEKRSMEEFSIKKGLSIEDREAIDKVDKSTRELDNGSFEVGVPWRSDDPIMPNNRFVAEKRMMSLCTRLRRDPELKEGYTSAFKKLLENGDLEKVPKPELNRPDGKVSYIPHHAVKNDHKKLRVVLDTASKVDGKSLSTEILPGPNVLNQLGGVMLRFRQYPVAVTGDISGFYHAIRMSKKDSDFHRIFFYENPEDINSEIIEYRYLKFIFGGVQSQFVAIRTLHRAIDRAVARDQIMESEAEDMKNGFYSDDSTRSYLTKSEALEQTRKTIEVLASAGFCFKKIDSNYDEILEELPEELKLPPDAETALSEDERKVLGHTWNRKEDKFIFDITKIRDAKIETKRQLLSVLASLFDPNGLISYLMVDGKLILQDIFQHHHIEGKKDAWDDELDPTFHDRIQKWQKKLTEEPTIEFNRMLLKEKPKAIELHMFGDATLRCAAAVAILRTTQQDGTYRCSLLATKNRIAPLRSNNTIVRQELTAAVIAVELAEFVKTELDINIDEQFFWSDSTAVLGMLFNRKKRFQIFVTNRLNKIRALSNLNEWRHVASEQNAADFLSRGVMPNFCESKDDRYFPNFLFENKENWPKPIDMNNIPIVEEVLVNEKESKGQKNAIAGASFLTNDCQNGNDLIRSTIRLGTWAKIKNVFAWISRFLHNIKNRNTRIQGPLKPRDIYAGELLALKVVQREAFNEEISLLKKDSNIILPKGNPLRKMTPFVDHEGLMRIRSRVQNNDKDKDFNNPIILPGYNKSVETRHLTEAITMGYHRQREFHLKTNDVLSKMKQRFHISGMRAFVRNAIKKCHGCERFRCLPAEQVMSDLPNDRISISAKPFYSSGLDVFGPFYVTIGRSSHKRYIALFTCTATRAVHLEVIHTLEMDSMIDAIRRFQARRGKIAVIRADNATNNRSSDKEFQEAIQTWNGSEFGRQFQQDGIEFKFNTPYASHHGGFFERMIRSAREILRFAIVNKSLRDETLLTIVAEVEYLLNSRPLTHVGVDIEDPMPLKPNDFLLPGENFDQLPPGVFDESDEKPPIRKRWRYAQRLIDNAWKRLQIEYFTELRKRDKWLKKRKNLKIGDLVIAENPNEPRSIWPIGVVRDVKIGKDNFVRSASIKIKGHDRLYDRPITKLFVIEKVAE